jgi:hypothetical protein
LDDGGDDVAVVACPDSHRDYEKHEVMVVVVAHDVDGGVVEDDEVTA